MTKGIVAGCLVLLLLSACRPKPTPSPPTTLLPGNSVALLPGDDGKTGALAISNAAGVVSLTQSNTISFIAAQDIPPGQPEPLGEPEIARRFGSALDGLPAPLAEFILYFDHGTDRLTPASEALIFQLLQAVARSQSKDIGITGHTDRSGPTAFNYALGLRRAERIAAILIEHGSAREFLSVESHGETNPRVPTADRVEEPRNRRVEVIIR